MTRILFVDDEPNVLFGLQRQLHHKTNEWHIGFVESASDALQFMAAHPTDVLVTDFMMPDVNGGELIRKTQERFPETTPIVLSGQCPPGDVMRFAQQGIKYLTKPCEPSILLRTITHAVSLRVSYLREQSPAKGRFRVVDSELADVVSVVMRQLVELGTIRPDELPPQTRLALIRARSMDLMGTIIKEPQVDADLLLLNWLNRVSDLCSDSEGENDKHPVC